MFKEFNSIEYKKQLSESCGIQDCPKVPLPYIDENQNFIFVSYSHKDYKDVYSDLADMYNVGVRFWYDKGLSAGKKWDEEVTEKLLSPNCVGVIFFMSKNLFLSQSCNREIETVYSITEDKDNSKNLINYFSVNLTDKMPIQILSETMSDPLSGALDMNMISVLSRAFPDNATYLYYNSPEHQSELITQIQNQFGVISSSENTVTFKKDLTPSTVFIGTLIGTLDRSSRKELAIELRQRLENMNISSYIMKEDPCGYIDEDEATSLKSFINKQNEEKFNTAKCIILISGVLEWAFCARTLMEFDPSSIHEKKIFYLVCSENYGDEEAYFLKYYESLIGDEQFEKVKSRVFFDKDSKKKLIESIIKAATE